MSRWHKHEWDLLPERAFSPRPSGGMTLEGGKGSSAPAPDPRLVEAQIRSMGIQDSAIQGILELQNRLQPLQEQQMQFGLDAQRTAFDQSQEDRQWALGRRSALTGIQDQLISEAKAFDTEAKREQLAGQAMGDVSQAFAAQRGISGRALGRMGVNPNDGKYAAMIAQNGIGEAIAKSGAANRARDVARQEGTAMKQGVANMMAGYPAMGMQASGAGAQYAANGIGIANQGLAGMNSGFGQAASIAGAMGTNATGMWGQQANYHANMQSRDTFGGFLGGLGGLAMGLGKSGLGWSDRRLKQNTVLVGQDERTGLNLYEFSYIGGSGKRYRGVMADEVAQVMPGAVSTAANGFMAVDYGALGIDMVEVA